MLNIQIYLFLRGMDVKDKLKLYLCISFSLIVAISVSTQLVQIVYAQSVYQLRVNTFGGTFEQRANGVDIAILNRMDGTVKVHRYLALPPPSTYFFYDFFSPGTALRVCAFNHGTSDIINCKDITAGFNPSEFVTLSLSPLRF
jgi:hypothetical protein